MSDSGANAIVQQQFTLAKGYADAASTKVDTFVTALNAAIYTAPVVSVTWVDPTLGALPAMPALVSAPTIAFTAPDVPALLTATLDPVTFDTFTEIAPTLTFGTAPTLSFGSAPVVPSAGAVTVADAPTLATVTTPTLLGLNTPTFGGVDLHPEYLVDLMTIPTLSLVAPTPYSYSVGADYASSLLTTLQAVATTRLAGGTGLNSAVEQAIWDRSRLRETSISLANSDEIMRASEALGFQLPTGVLAAQLRKTQQDYYDKLSGLSRDVAIKQAELEQENLKQSIAQGIDLEGKLIDYSYKMEQLTFETAKLVAENAIQRYNAQVEQFKAVLSAYQVYSSNYKTIIEGAMAGVEVYKAELQAEQTKASINATLVAQYKAQIDAGMASVQIYQAQVSTANALVQLEQAKIGAAGEQVKAYVATINAETAKVEAYKASVSAEATKMGIYKTKAEVFGTVVGAQAEQAKLALGYYTGQVQAKGQEWDAYKSQVDAEKARMQALASQSEAMWGGFKAVVAKVEAETNTQSRIWEASIKKSEAVSTLSLQASKANADVILQTNNARMEAAKVGSQVYSQLTASAYGIIHAQAGTSFSSNAGTTVNYSYKNDTSSKPGPMIQIT